MARLKFSDSVCKSFKISPFGRSLFGSESRSMNTLDREKHEARRFHGQGVSYKGKFLGALAVSEARGDQMCQEAVCELKTIVRAAGEHKQRIVFGMSVDGIRVRDERTGDCLYFHPISKISFISQDLSDKRIFGYIHCTIDSGYQFFAIKVEKDSKQVILSLRSLFCVVFEMKKHELESRRQRSSAEKCPLSCTISRPSPNNNRLLSAKTSLSWALGRANREPLPNPPNAYSSISCSVDLMELQREMDCLEESIQQTSNNPSLYDYPPKKCCARGNKSSTPDSVCIRSYSSQASCFSLDSSSSSCALSANIPAIAPPPLQHSSSAVHTSRSRPMSASTPFSTKNPVTSQESILSALTAANNTPHFSMNFSSVSDFDPLCTVSSQRSLNTCCNAMSHTPSTFTSRTSPKLNNRQLLELYQEPSSRNTHRPHHLITPHFPADVPRDPMSTCAPSGGTATADTCMGFEDNFTPPIIVTSSSARSAHLTPHDSARPRRAALASKFSMFDFSSTDGVSSNMAGNDCGSSPPPFSPPPIPIPPLPSSHTSMLAAADRHPPQFEDSPCVPPRTTCSPAPPLPPKKLPLSVCNTLHCVASRAANGPQSSGIVPTAQNITRHSAASSSGRARRNGTPNMTCAESHSPVSHTLFDHLHTQSGLARLAERAALPLSELSRMSVVALAACLQDTQQHSGHTDAAQCVASTSRDDEEDISSSVGTVSDGEAVDDDEFCSLSPVGSSSSEVYRSPVDAASLTALSTGVAAHYCYGPVDAQQVPATNDRYAAVRHLQSQLTSDETQSLGDNRERTDLHGVNGLFHEGHSSESEGDVASDHAEKTQFLLENNTLSDGDENEMTIGMSWKADRLGNECNEIIKESADELTERRLLICDDVEPNSENHSHQDDYSQDMHKSSYAIATNECLANDNGIYVSGGTRWSSVQSRAWGTAAPAAFASFDESPNLVDENRDVTSSTQQAVEKLNFARVVVPPASRSDLSDTRACTPAAFVSFDDSIPSTCIDRLRPNSKGLTTLESGFSIDDPFANDDFFLAVDSELQRDPFGHDSWAQEFNEASQL